MNAWPPIEEVLPHRGTMLLLDRVEDYAPTHVRCSYTPRADAWYADAGGAMPAWYGIELMAQTVAAHVGLTARQAGRPPRLGALLGSRAFRTQRAAFPAEIALAIEASVDYRDESGLASYQCRICVGDEEIATARLSVYEPDDFALFLSSSAHSNASHSV